MVYKCGMEITPHIPVIVQLCLEYLCYDPNYNYDEDEENGDDMDVDDGDGEDDDESDEEYSDDDDMSWKVGNRNAFTPTHSFPTITFAGS